MAEHISNERREEMQSEKRKYDVTAFGELLIDFTDSGLSEQGNPVLEANPGGAVTNMLSMLSRFGRKTAYIGKVGNDGFGYQLESALKEQGIDTSGLRFDDEVHTTLAIVLKRENGDRDFAFYRNPGADMMLRKDEVDPEIIRNSRVFHTGTLSMTDPGIEETHKYALETAIDAGCIITFGPNLRPPLWKSPDIAREKIEYGLAKSDAVKISDEEITFISGEKDIARGARMIKDKFEIPFLCATLGLEGSICYFRDLEIFAKPYLTDRTIETTGAGDAFCACMVNGIFERGIDNWDEGSIREMLDFANAAASLVTTKKGALRVMPEINEVRKFMEEFA